MLSCVINCSGRTATTAILRGIGVNASHTPAMEEESVWRSFIGCHRRETGIFSDCLGSKSSGMYRGECNGEVAGLNEHLLDLDKPETGLPRGFIAASHPLFTSTDGPRKFPF